MINRLPFLGLLLLLPACCDETETLSRKNIRLDNEIKEQKLKLLKKLATTCDAIPVEVILQDDVQCLGVQVQAQQQKRNSSAGGAVANRMVMHNAAARSSCRSGLSSCKGSSCHH